MLHAPVTCLRWQATTNTGTPTVINNRRRRGRNQALFRRLAQRRVPDVTGRPVRPEPLSAWAKPVDPAVQPCTTGCRGGGNGGIHSSNVWKVLSARGERIGSPRRRLRGVSAVGAPTCSQHDHGCVTRHDSRTRAHAHRLIDTAATSATIVNVSKDRRLRVSPRGSFVITELDGG